MAKRVLITGIDGFTGHHLRSLLEASGFDVYGISRTQSSEDTYVAELLDIDALEQVVKKVNPNYVIHLAAISFVQHGSASEIYQTNVIGTLNLLEALKRNAHQLQSVIIASSANIYGNDCSGKISEESLPAPVNYYAASKASMELAVAPYFYDLPLTIVRPFNYTGAGQSNNFLIPKIVSHFAQGKRVIELGNTNISRDFSDVRDVVCCYKDLMLNSQSIGKIFNVCSGKSVSLNEIIAKLERIAGYSISITTNPDFVRKNDVLDLWGSNDLLYKTIDYRYKFDMDLTLSWMFESFKGQTSE
ncbi:UDP-glucose 4-epimerase [Neiella marina]|uniref:UDP-glucose 4-epimerase n=1 Tax=Neiella marina TaxID=508461 RepID=A0A8J2U5D8_9GAMM|nr:GDP-mannose 4,6-dehydratase [Neiella marina]GGA78501.1 UDP-glucose 4-epimerase [Neiella marina]